MLLYVTLPPRYWGKVQGLCGNFNGIATDDFTTKNGIVETNPSTFANSFQEDANCPKSTETTDDSCGQNKNREHWAKMSCSIITGKVFEKCHNKVSNTLYLEPCRHVTMLACNRVSLYPCKLASM